MIKGKRKIELTPDTVLRMISDYDIFRQYIPDTHWKIGQVMISPLRDESHPSFLIGNKGGHLSFIDFSSGVKGDCFEFVKEKFHLSSLDDVLKMIDRDFGLGITSNHNLGEYKKITSEYKQPESLGKRYSVIQCVTRRFTKAELDYWVEYYQTEEDLRAEKVYSIKEVYLNKKRFPLGINEMRFGYYYPNANSTWKIYLPFSNKKRKWISNVPLTTAEGLENLCLGHNTLIVKSKKDYMVCKKVYPYTCYVQNESIFAFSDEVVEYINSHSKEVYYGGDSDEAGKSASYIITEAFKWKHINSPDRLLPEINDWADWAKLEGLEALGKHFKEKSLYE